MTYTSDAAHDDGLGIGEPAPPFSLPLTQTPLRWKDDSSHAEICRATYYGSLSQYGYDQGSAHRSNSVSRGTSFTRRNIQGLRTILDPFMLKMACAYKKS